jgi:hypothetical protein
MPGQAQNLAKGNLNSMPQIIARSKFRAKSRANIAGAAALGA